MLLNAEDSFLEVAHLIRILENQMGLAFSIHRMILGMPIAIPMRFLIFLACILNG